VTGLPRASLQVTRRKRRPLADRCGVAEENALLAAEQLAFMLCERRHVDVAHARLDRARDFGEDRVLHFRAALDQADLLVALDRLEAIDEIGRIHERSAGRPAL